MKGVTTLTTVADEAQPELDSAQGGHPQRRSLGKILREIKHRRVSRAAVTYVLVMWLNLQIGDVLFPMLGLPAWSLQLIIVLGAMGFPAVLILAWVFQITPGGIVVDSPQHEVDAKSDGQFDAVINLVLLVLSVGLALLITVQFMSERGDEPAGAAGRVEYVFSDVHFQAASPGPEAEAFVVGVEEEIRHRLINRQGFFLGPAAASQASSEAAHRLVLSGSVALNSDGFHVLTHLLSLSQGKYLVSLVFDVETQPSMSDAESMVAQRVVAELEKVVKTIE